MRTKVLLTSLFLLITSISVFALERFGDASVSSGSLVIVRNGAIAKHVDSEKSLEILNGDLLQVTQGGGLVLITVDESEIIAGDRTLLMVQVWQQGAISGYLHLIYGKVRINTTGEFGMNRKFTVKTPTAAVRIKGSGWLQVASNGSTLAIVDDGKIWLQGRTGISRVIESGKMSMAMEESKVTVSVEYPDDIKTVFRNDQLASLPLHEEKAVNLESEHVFVDKGLIEQQHIDRSKLPGINIEERFDMDYETAVSEEIRMKEAATRMRQDTEFQTDLNKLHQLELETVTSETDEYGFLIKPEEPEVVFDEFDGPRLPKLVIDMDDISANTRKSGFIEIRIEK